MPAKAARQKKGMQRMDACIPFLFMFGFRMDSLLPPGY